MHTFCDIAITDAVNHMILQKKLFTGCTKGYNTKEYNTKRKHKGCFVMADYFVH